MDEFKKRKLVQFYKKRECEFTLDDITFNDLDLDEFFEKSDYTSSSLGEEVLYSILRQPSFSEEELSKREQIIRQYSDNPETVKRLNRKLSKIGKLKKISIFEYLFKLEEAPHISIPLSLRAIILILISLAVIPFNSVAGILVFVAVFIFNCIAYFKLRGRIEPYFICVYYLTRAIKIAEDIPETDKNNLARIKNLTRGSFLLGKVNGITVNSGSGNPLDVLTDFLRMTLHFDILTFVILNKRICSNVNLISKTLEEIGNVDACISIGVYRSKIDNYCIPVFDVAEKPFIRIEKGVHPLLSNPVPNSVSFEKPVLLTGSNASGKSTFLRMCALCAVLAQTYHTVPALKYESSMFRVISSMKISDSIGSGESFYVAEVRALKRIIDASESQLAYPVLAITDEILRGTNTIERVAASSQVVKFLSSRTLCISATHDIELTYILEGICENYHFSEDISDDDISFSFKIKEGRADTRNAIKLLKLEGFPPEVIDSSQILAQEGFDRFISE